jgi:hypothetical protein
MILFAAKASDHLSVGDGIAALAFFACLAVLIWVIAK